MRKAQTSRPRQLRKIYLGKVYELLYDELGGWYCITSASVLPGTEGHDVTVTNLSLVTVRTALKFLVSW
jgi:hypothetical protein